MTVPDIVADDSELNHAERAFLEGVFACHGVREQPTASDFRASDEGHDRLRSTSPG